MDQKAIMRRVIELSRAGMRDGFGGPFGTVIVKDGEIVGEGHNEVLATNDPTAHAEVLAIRRAGAKLGTFDLSGLRDVRQRRAVLHVHGQHPVGEDLQGLLRAEPGSFGRDRPGDEHLYAEMARPLGDGRSSR